MGGGAARRRYWARHAMLKRTISKAASRSSSRMPGLFPGQNGSKASRPVASVFAKLRICFGENGRQNPPTRSWHICQDRRNVHPRILAEPTTRNHTGARAISRRWLSRKAPRRSLVSDARWRKIETGTRNTGTSTSGNRLTSSFGRSKANNRNAEGEVKNPAVTATTKSASPNRFHTETRLVFSRGPRRHANATPGARTPPRTLPRPAGKANNPGKLARRIKDQE